MCLSYLHQYIPLREYSPPRKEKYIKYPTGKYVVPQKQIIRVNPNRGKQGGIPEKEYPKIANNRGDPSWRQTELILMCQRENSNGDPSWHQKNLITRCQRKQRGILERESLGIFIPKGDLSWRQKDVIPRCQREHFAPTEFKIQIWVLNFGREEEYNKI